MRRPGVKLRLGQKPRPKKPLLVDSGMQRRPARMAEPRPIVRLPLQRYERQRKSWAGIPIIGGFIELIGKIVYPREEARVAKRMPLGSRFLPGAKRKGRLQVRLELEKYGYSPRQRRGPATGRRKAA